MCECVPQCSVPYWKQQMEQEERHSPRGQSESGGEVQSPPPPSIVSDRGQSGASGSGCGSAGGGGDRGGGPPSAPPQGDDCAFLVDETQFFGDGDEIEDEFEEEGDQLALGPDGSDLTTYENKCGLAEDMKFLASMPELCDITFLVGETREPVCAVKAVLAARSR